MGTALIVVADREDAEQIDAWLLGRTHGSIPSFRPVHHDPEAGGLADVSPSLAILDASIPAKARFLLASRLRLAAETRAVPIVLIEAGPEAKSEPPHVAITPQAVVRRPLDRVSFLEGVRQALAWRSGLDARLLTHDLELHFHSVPSLMHEAVEFVTMLARQTSLRAEQVRQLRHVLVEMGQNAVEWGNRYHVESLVRLCYKEHADRLEVVVQDEGAGFNPATLPHAANLDDPVAHLEVRDQLGLREGGFGLMICRGLVDDLRYNARGNEVTLVKRFTAEAEDAG